MKKMTRRDFLKAAGTAAVGVAAYNLEGVRNVFAAGEGSVKVSANGGAGSRAKVYFSKNINADTLIKLYDMINEGIYGKVARLQLNCIPANRTARTFCRAKW